MTKKRATNAGAKPKRSVLERLKGNSKPGSKLFKDMTPEDHTSLLAGILDRRRDVMRAVELAANSGLQSANEFLAAKGLPHGDIDSILRAGRIVGIPVDDILDMNLGELIDEAEIIDERESWKAQKVAEALQRSGNATTREAPSTATSAKTEAAKPEWLVTVSKLVPTLKGKQRRVVELLITGDGEYPIADLASDDAIKWKAPYKNAVEGMVKALNRKFGNHNLLVDQFANALRIAPMNNRPQKQN